VRGVVTEEIKDGQSQERKTKGERKKLPGAEATVKPLNEQEATTHIRYYTFEIQLLYKDL